MNFKIENLIICFEGIKMKEFLLGETQSIQGLFLNSFIYKIKE